MRMISTRGGGEASAASSIVRGIAGDGGLFVPEAFPALPHSFARDWARLAYHERAARLLTPLLSEYAGLDAICRAAYGDNFSHAAIAPVRSIDADTALLELFHGPTLAFKDMALQILPRLLTEGMRIAGADKRTLILVATSGDTGKAALEGFRDVPGVRIAVYYPAEGVSSMQKLQMAVQEGENVAVIAVRGNFDDAQTGVKRMFADPVLADRLARGGWALSSANSINWGRLAPQIAYYASAYADMVKSGAVAEGRPINAAVPTGNFGNILAAYYARRMGVPIARLICASNRNNVLADFIKTGRYDSNRAFHTTTSPSMDILISSNLERFLFEISGRDAAAVRGWMASLRDTGRYAIGPGELAAMREIMSGGWCDDRRAGETIARIWKESGVLLDPHTAVAAAVLDDYREATGDATPALIVGTASPYKFPDSVLDALGAGIPEGDAFASCARLEEITGIPVPASLLALKEKPVRHTAVCGADGMETALAEVVGM